MTESKRPLPPNAGKGRKPGVKNKYTVAVKTMVEDALLLSGHHLQMQELERIKAVEEANAKAKNEADKAEVPKAALQGMPPGVAYLMTQAINEPKAFMGLVTKLLPQKVDAEITVFQGEALVDRLQQGRALAAKQIEVKDGQHGIH